MPTFAKILLFIGAFSYNFFAIFLHNCMSFMIQPPEKDSRVYIHSMNQTIFYTIYSNPQQSSKLNTMNACSNISTKFNLNLFQL